MARTDTAEQRIAALKRARVEYSARKHRSVTDTIQRLTDNGSRITFELVARHAGVSRQFLYGDKELRAAIEQARREPPSAPPTRARTSDTDGLQTDLLLAREEISRLRAENTKLKTKLIERAAGAMLDGQDAAVHNLTTRNAELVRENADLRRQLAHGQQDLDAARATNRDLMTELNRHHRKSP
jgi:regulator of replication initiation timing